MKQTAKQIKEITKLRRKYHHPLIHKVHKKYPHISRKTLFYMKEYGPRTHVSVTIARQSLKILLIASVLSSIGGLGLKSIQDQIVTIIPLIILLPALNDMIGDFGTVVSSKFTTLLYKGKIERVKSSAFRDLFIMIFFIALISSVFLGTMAIIFSYLIGYALTADIILKVFGIAVLSTLILVSSISAVSITFGFYIFKRNEDPNNFLIPISTSIADVGSMTLFVVMVTLIF